MTSTDVLAHRAEVFLRDIAELGALIDEGVLDIVARRRAAAGLTIWCAGCLSGPEVYRVAIAVAERFPELAADGRLQVVATDLVPSLVERLKSGRFSQIEVNRGIPVRLLLRHFQQEGTEWVARRQLRQLVDVRTLKPAGPPGANVERVRGLSAEAFGGTLVASTISRGALGDATRAALTVLFDDPVEIRPEPGVFSLAAGVRVSGPHETTVVVRVSNDLISAYTASVFGVGEDHVSEADRRDALLDLTDMLAGAAKTALDGDHSLAMAFPIPVDLVNNDVATAENVITFRVSGGIISLLIVSRVLATLA